MIDASDPDSPLVWRDDGLPASRLYGDVYFSSVDGLAETRAVFLDGCGLPDAWAGRDHFTVGELGFGTGLNIAALLDLWRRSGPPGGRLHIFSVEGHPISRDAAARALAVWPELGEAAGALLDAWPGRAHGFHRLDLPGFNATLDLAVMEVGEALAAWDGAADAWFLDGFSPALNPAMWREDILAAVATRSAPGARAATFTIAGAVRRGLVAAGFEIERRPGFGRKRERLEARAPGAATPIARPRRLAVVGAGIAGAAVARAARAEGLAVTVIDAGRPPASGNRSALVTPAFDAGGGPRAALHAQAFARAVALYDAFPEALIARGALQLPASPKDPARFAAIAEQPVFEPDAVSPLSAAETTARLGEAAEAGLAVAEARVIRPGPILAAWSGAVLAAAVARIERHGEVWRLFDADEAVIAEAEAVVLTAGADQAGLWPAAPLQPVRGQVSWTPLADPVPPAVAFGGYAIPTGDGVLFGATHDRDQSRTDVRAGDHARNLEILAKGLPGLAARVAGLPLEGRAAVRAATPDRLPLAGAVPGQPDGLAVLGGLGARGFCLAPLLAEHVVAELLSLASPLPAPLARLVDPGRYAASSDVAAPPGA